MSREKSPQVAQRGGDSFMVVSEVSDSGVTRSAEEGSYLLALVTMVYVKESVFAAPSGRKAADGTLSALPLFHPFVLFA
jgi:hypothetical protein